MKKISYDEFLDTFLPVKNHIDKNAGYGGFLFETYGEEEEWVRKFADTNPNRVWTLLTGLDEGDTLVSGFHYVNRFGYFITEIPFDEGEEIEIILEEDIEP